MTRLRGSLLIAAGGLAAVAAALAVPWGHGRYREFLLARAAPRLDPEMRRHIATDSDPEWYAYCRKASTDPMAAAAWDLVSALHTGDFRKFERRRAPVEAAFLRLGEAFRELHGMDALERRTRRDIALPARLDFENRQWERRHYALVSDTALTPEARVHEIDRIVSWFMANGDSGRALFATATAAAFELERGRSDLHLARLEAASALARAIGEYHLLCQVLGEIGTAHLYAGRYDSMRACFDEGIDLARRHLFIDQAARLLRFYAGYYEDRGRLAVALDRLSEAIRLANGPGGMAAQPRMQIEYTDFLANHGCWDLVDRSLRRVPPLLRRMSAPGQAVSRDRYGFDADLLRARLAFATGRADEGDRLMRRLSESVPPGGRWVLFADVLHEWSLGLERAKRAREALEICARGLAHCDTTLAPDHVPSFLLRAARLEASLGRVDAADSLLERLTAIPSFASGSATRRLEAEVLRARLPFLRGQTRLARQRIEHLFRRYRAQRRDDGGGSAGNLEAAGANSLRDAMHEIGQFTPEQAYAFEMEWRSLTRRPGPRADQPSDPAWSSTRPGSHPAAGTHLVYRFAGDAVVRWMADSQGTTADTIPLSAERCMAEVRSALDVIQSEPAEPGGLLGPESRARLRRLSDLLLPRALAVSRDRPLRLDITPDGPLAALPFEALPFPPSSGAPPLALAADIAYLCAPGGAPPGDGGDAVIVSNPRLPDDLALRYGWTARLSESDVEARDAQKRWPRAAMLSGTEATKERIRARWPGASIIYLAAHHVREPDAPFLGFVPLPAPAGAPPDAAVLESADIRALDLTSCRLAVLASCASGAPYHNSARPGPSLADAFLDAGAASVVRSFWDVGDAETREFMRVFLSHWRPEQPDAVSLGRARREVMRTPAGASPRVWAVWSVQTASSR